MKYLALILLVVVAAAFAVAPTYTSTGANQEWQLEKEMTSSVFPDTLTGTTDSAKWVSMYQFTPGWEYILSKGVSTGTDSNIILRMDLYDNNKVFLRSISIDTVKLASEDIMLPIFRTDWAGFADIVAKAPTFGGSTSMITASKKIKIVKRRVVPVTPVGR